MSRYGYLVCYECDIYLGLGKYIRGKDDGAPFFHSGNEDDPPNSRQSELTRALWKFHAEHQHHRIQVLLSGDPEFEELDDIAEIGGDRPAMDVEFDAYLDGWPG